MRPQEINRVFGQVIDNKAFPRELRHVVGVAWFKEAKKYKNTTGNCPYLYVLGESKSGSLKELVFSYIMCDINEYRLVWLWSIMCLLNKEEHEKDILTPSHVAMYNKMMNAFAIKSWDLAATRQMYPHEEVAKKFKQKIALMKAEQEKISD